MSTTYGYVEYAELNQGPVEPINGPFNNPPLFTFSPKNNVASFGIIRRPIYFSKTAPCPRS